jgi:putative transcriptional regulator
MNLKPGICIASTSKMDDPNFAHTTILITELNKEGATGFILYKKYHRSLNQLVEFSHCKAFPLYDGGPVEQDKLFFIHAHPETISSGIKLREKLYVGGDFVQALELLNNQTPANLQLKLFIGYCGWDANELETEIENGYWEITPVPGEAIFK